GYLFTSDYLNDQLLREGMHIPITIAVIFDIATLNFKYLLSATNFVTISTT
ncbi:unnamed protein product, partial [Rotaria sordida]